MLVQGSLGSAVDHYFRPLFSSLFLGMSNLLQCWRHETMPWIDDVFEAYLSNRVKTGSHSRDFTFFLPPSFLEYRWLWLRRPILRHSSSSTPPNEYFPRWQIVRDLQSPRFDILHANQQCFFRYFRSRRYRPIFCEISSSLRYRSPFEMKQRKVAFLVTIGKVEGLVEGSFVKNGFRSRNFIRSRRDAKRITLLTRRLAT